jgi:carbon storage regulator
MLVLSRKRGEKVVIGKDITLTIEEIRGNRVRISIDAPDQVRILRGELLGKENLTLLDPDLEVKPLNGKWTPPIGSCPADKSGSA